MTDKSEIYDILNEKINYIRANIKTISVDEAVDLEVVLATLRASLGEEFALAQKIADDADAYLDIVEAEKWVHYKRNVPNDVKVIAKDIEASVSLDAEIVTARKTLVARRFDERRSGNLYKSCEAIINALKDKAKLIRDDEINSPQQETRGEF